MKLSVYKNPRNDHTYAINRKGDRYMIVERDWMGNMFQVMAFYKMSILTNWILHDKWGFGAGRLQKFQDEMARLCACVNDPACGVSVDEIGLQLKQETGYDTVYQLNKRRYNENAEVAV
jgi:hypothetical protein